MGVNSIDEKQCSKCKEVKQVDKFGRSKKAKDGLSSWCKQCMCSHMQLKRAGLIETKIAERSLVKVEAGSKWCSECRLVKILEEFGNSKSSKDGKRPQCKLCNCERTKQYIEENHEEVNRKKRVRRKDPEVKAQISDYNKTRYWDNREEDLKKQKEYRARTHLQQLERYKRYHANNKEKEKARDAVYRTIHREYYNEKRRVHRKEFPHLANANTRKRACQKVKATPSWSDPNKILLFYEHSSLMNKLTGTQYQVDHIHPINSKLICGLHVETNLRVITKEENVRKNNKFIPYSEDRYGNITYYPLHL